jgi:hypothetical protein
MSRISHKPIMTPSEIEWLRQRLEYCQAGRSATRRFMLHMGGLSVQDIAETDGVTREAVYSQIAKVADALRKEPTLSEYKQKALPARPTKIKRMPDFSGTLG